MDGNTNSNSNSNAYYQRGYRDGYDAATAALLDAIAHNLRANGDYAAADRYDALAHDYRAERGLHAHRPAGGIALCGDGGQTG